MAQPTPTYAQARDQLKAWAHLHEEHDKWLNANATNFLGLVNTVVEGVEGDFSSDLLGLVRGMRGDLQRPQTEGRVAAGLAICMRDMMLAIGERDKGLKTNMETFRDYMIANSLTMNSFGNTYGSVVAGGSNVGSGLLYRLTKDKDGHDLEAVHLEAKSAQCIDDENQNREFRERFRVTGANQVRDATLVSGSGVQEILTALNPTDNSSKFLENPNFRVNSGTPAPGSPVTPSSTTDLPGWILSAFASFSVDADIVYRGAPGVSVPVSLRMIANANFSQILKDNRNPSIDPDRAIFVQQPVYRDALADGTLTGLLGSESVATTVTSLTNSAWNLITHPLTKARYYKNFKTSGLSYKQTLASRTVGSLYFAPPIISYMNVIDGIPHAVVGGATNFSRDDSFSWTDSIGARGVLIYWMLFRSGLQKIMRRPFMLPINNSGTENITDP